MDQNNNEKLRRTHRTSILFNQREQEAINLYCEKYKIRNKSKFMREVIMTGILKKFDEDYPTLFEFEKPNLFRFEIGEQRALPVNQYSRLRSKSSGLRRIR